MCSTHLRCLFNSRDLTLFRFSDPPQRDLHSLSGRFCHFLGAFATIPQVVFALQAQVVPPDRVNRFLQDSCVFARKDNVVEESPAPLPPFSNALVVTVADLHEIFNVVDVTVHVSGARL